MGAVILALASAALIFPKEYHIDCSGWNGGARAECDIRIVTLNGRVLSSGIVVQPNTASEDVRDAIESLLKTAGMQYRNVGKSIVVLEGAKDGAIRSVEFKSRDWKPDVRVVLKK